MCFRPSRLSELHSECHALDMSRSTPESLRGRMGECPPSCIFQSLGVKDISFAFAQQGYRRLSRSLSGDSGRDPRYRDLAKLLSTMLGFAFWPSHLSRILGLSGRVSMGHRVEISMPLNLG